MEEQNKKTKANGVLENANKWYGFYPKLPKIVLIITGILFFIWGIVDPAVFQYSGGGYFYKTTYYGIMHCESAFGAWFIWQLIGWAIAAINFVILKLVLSPMIVQIECLKEINENTKNTNKEN